MIAVEYDGRSWRFETPRPVFARVVHGLQGTQGWDLIRELRGILLENMTLDDWCTFEADREDLPDDAEAELFMRWLEDSTGKPMTAVNTLCHVAVSEWGMVRGRLIMAGIARPLHDLDSLAALLDAVDTMIREGHQDKKQADKYQREVYKPRIRSERGKAGVRPGFAPSDMATQNQMLENLAG